MSVLTELANLIFSVVAAGLATYGISTIVAIEAGPFAIFDRLREALLPDCEPDSIPVPLPPGTIIPSPGEQSTIPTPRPEPVHPILPIDPQVKQKAFDRTLKGTIHGIFDCAVCFGVWIVFPVALLPVWMGMITWLEYPLVGLAAYGFHRFLLGVAGDI